MRPNPYLPIPAEIEDIVDETPTIKTFVLRPEAPVPFRAGQFVELALPGVGEAPFTPSSAPSVTERMEITIMRVGRVTRALHALAPGAALGVRGPLGEPYPLDRFKDQDVVIVGGGCGVGPLRALLYELIAERDRYKQIYIRYGARTPADIVYHEAAVSGWDMGDALDVMLTVDAADESWKGHVGVVTTILEDELLPCRPKEAVAVICGPPIMMKFSVEKLLTRGFQPDRVYLSMEKNMSCGIGKCGHCRIGPYYSCREGPVFLYQQLEGYPGLWE
jgi:NAD(P)H-flavin reductase